MCYDIKASKEAQLKRARRVGDEQVIEEINKILLPLTDLPIYHASGFTHPKLLIYTNTNPLKPVVATWGLVPHWVRDESQLKKYWNNTLNARGETIFDKPSFKTSAENKRCLIYVDGFYEHHHYNKETFPFYIHKKNDEPMALAGLWSDWTNPKSGETLISFSIVTTVGNSMMSKIHNNPKMQGARMPLILSEEIENQWLQNISEPVDEDIIKNLIQPLDDSALTAHTVRKLRGKQAVGNVLTASEHFEYTRLDF